MSDRNWIKFTVLARPGLLEHLSAYLFALGALGIEEGSNSFTVFFAEDVWNREKQHLLHLLEKNITDFRTDRLKIERLADKDWNKGWKEYFKPFRLLPNLMIRPSWETYTRGEGEQVIVINPQMAFGTGHHESTQLILFFLAELNLAGRSVLDVGTGSGILAIYCAQQGADPVWAVDSDPRALENAKENCDLNKVGSKIKLVSGTLSAVAEQKFDFVLANINRAVLLNLRDSLKNYVQPTGKLILSGLLQTDFEFMQDGFGSAGWRIIDRKNQNEWMALILQHADL